MSWSVERNGPMLRVTVEPPLGPSRADLFDRVIGEVETGGVWTVELPTSLEQGYVEDHAILDALRSTLDRMKVVILRPAAH
jgi:hypothetical protein